MADRAVATDTRSCRFLVWHCPLVAILHAKSCNWKTTRSSDARMDCDAAINLMTGRSFDTQPPSQSQSRIWRCEWMAEGQGRQESDVYWCC